MNRLQKKCFLASTGAHLLLAAILVIGPAFVSSESRTVDMPILDFVPAKTVDALISGGGYRDAKPPAAAPVVQPQAPAPQPQAPAPAPERQRDPDPPKDPPKELPQPKTEPDSLIPSDHKRTPEISTKLVTRKSTNDSKAKVDSKANEDAKAQAQRRREFAQQIANAANRIGDEVSGSTSIKLQGPGGGGVPYANFFQSVKSAYDRAWIVPEGAADSKATTVVSVTIAKDGKVVRSRITERSGNALVDQSVDAVLRRVTYAAPLPDDAETERTVTINFKVKPKQGLG